MEIKTISILLIEDNPDDVFFLRMMLQKVAGVHFELHPVTDLASGLTRLAQGNIDVILLDLSLPDSSGMATFSAIKSRARDVPIIVLSGTDDETLAVNAVHAGAEDYLVKGHVNSQLISRAIIYAIERTESKGAVLKAEQKYRGIFENSVAGIFQTSPQGAYLDVNPALIRIYGYSSREDVMSSISDIAKLLYVNPNRRAEFVKLMQEHNVVHDFESQIYRKDGSIIWISENARAVTDDQGKVLYYEGMVEDITARKEAEEKVRFSELRFRSIWQKSFDGMRLTDERGTMVAVNPAFCQIVGLPAESLVGRPYTAIYSETEDLADMAQKYQQRFAEKKIESQFERHVIFRTGKAVDVELSNSFVEVEEGRSLVLSVFRDVTVRRQAEERERQVNAELARSQAELRKKNEILEDDLKLARDIQQAILPQQYPTFPPGAAEESSLVHFSHRYYPTGQVGGDFFNVLALSDTKAGLFICDVMGHGVRSALVTAMVRGLVEELRPIALDPGQLLTRINSDLRAILQQTGTPMFTTALYLVVDLERRQIYYSNAGHPRPFLIHRLQGNVEVLKNADGKARPALGLFAESTYPTASCDLAAGDLVMLFTDGLYEVEGPDDQQFSQELLLEAVRKNSSLHCAELFTATLAEIQQFSVNHQFSDDVCMVGMEVSEKF
ncbi:MAG TPA: SpoIIE family protein phosphatase [Candidatus Baltobacteraceae bacterium]|jgi:sigma-B regulation protein RsbU (phosphoserine phosphatase)|nr:SpoIIE family protein phosphatase [Candidatus Baltobacteraceae bacterium]